MKDSSFISLIKSMEEGLQEFEECSIKGVRTTEYMVHKPKEYGIRKKEKKIHSK